MREFIIYGLILASVMSPLVVWLFDDIEYMDRHFLDY